MEANNRHQQPPLGNSGMKTLERNTGGSGQDSEEVMRPLIRSSIRTVDLLTALLWIACLALLIIATVMMTQGQSDSMRGMLVIWSIFVGKMALGSTVVSTGIWVVRQFEEQLHISRNVEEINSELAQMRARRVEREAGGSGTVPHQRRL